MGVKRGRFETLHPDDAERARFLALPAGSRPPRRRRLAKKLFFLDIAEKGDIFAHQGFLP
jgi:hypothetical protein